MGKSYAVSCSIHFKIVFHKDNNEMVATTGKVRITKVVRFTGTFLKSNVFVRKIQNITNSKHIISYPDKFLFGKKIISHLRLKASLPTV